MRIGDLRHRISIQSKSRTSDGQGGGVVAGVELASVRACVEALSGSELLAATAIAATASYRIRIRSRVGVVPKAQVVWIDRGVTRTFQIVAVVPADIKRRETHLFCSERQS